MIRVPRTLFTKLLLVITVFCLLMTTICIFLMRGWHGSYHSEADQILNREVARNIVAQNLYIDRASLDASNYQEGMANLAQRHPMEEAYLLGADGSVLAAPVQAADIARQSVDIEPVKKFLSGVARLPIYGDDPQRLFGEAVFSAANIEIQGFPARYLYVILHPSDSGAVLNTVRRDYVFNETIGVLLLSALLAIFATLAIMRVLVRNLGRLEAAMEGFRASGFAALPAALPRSEMRHGDEIERLTGFVW